MISNANRFLVSLCCLFCSSTPTVMAAVIRNDQPRSVNLLTDLQSRNVALQGTVDDLQQRVGATEAFMKKFMGFTGAASPMTSENDNISPSTQVSRNSSKIEELKKRKEAAGQKFLDRTKNDLTSTTTQENSAAPKNGNHGKIHDGNFSRPTPSTTSSRSGVRPATTKMTQKLNHPRRDSSVLESAYEPATYEPSNRLLRGTVASKRVAEQPKSKNVAKRPTNNFRHPLLRQSSTRSRVTVLSACSSHCEESDQSVFEPAQFKTPSRLFQPTVATSGNRNGKLNTQRPAKTYPGRSRVGRPTARNGILRKV